MTQRFLYPFRIVRGTTAPSFLSNTNTASSANALQSTALGRVWSGGGSRSVRLAETSGVDYYVNFGSSLVSAGGSTDAMLVLGGTVETFHIEPSQTYIAIKSADGTTAAAVNITLGYGE